MIILFVIIFIFIYKITHQVHELKKINKEIIQAIALMDKLDKKN